jgi:hypothetical protein
MGPARVEALAKVPTTAIRKKATYFIRDRVLRFRAVAAFHAAARVGGNARPRYQLVFCRQFSVQNRRQVSAGRFVVQANAHQRHLKDELEPAVQAPSEHFMVPRW